MNGAGADPVIVGVGMMTAVGLSTTETAASVRAAIMRFEESSILDGHTEPLVMAQVPEDALPPLAEELADLPLTGREMRLLRLAHMPLLECIAAAPGSAMPLPVIISLPEQAAKKPIDPESFLSALHVQVPETFDRDRMAAPFTGRAGGIIALGRAADVIRSGQAEFVVAGGVDSYRDLMLLARLEAEGRVKTGLNLDGFIPGEAAGFVLMTRRHMADRLGLPVLGAILHWAHGVEAGHMYSAQPYRGDGLAATVKSVLAAAGVTVADVWSSMNGESHWAKEWGVTYMRNSGSIAESHAMHHPADCIGDTGAASAALMLGLALWGMTGGYYRSPCLIHASSDFGPRAAIVVRGGTVGTA